MIPLFKPSCTEEEIEAVNRVLRSGWWALGPETEKFEEEFAEYVGVRHAVAVNSATSALELAARALGVMDTVVITPALTFVSTALAMQHAGNRVVFADVYEDDLIIDWQDVDRKADRHTGPDLKLATAVVPVWFGGVVESPPLSISSSMDVIEDCAHAAGSFSAGNVGDIACWSFHAVKNLATGDGGMVTTNDPIVADRLRQLRWVGIDKSTWERDQGKYGWDYHIPNDGEKAHMNDIAAALGRVQLRRLDAMNRRRFDIAQYYFHNFIGLDYLKVARPDSYESNHMFIVRLAEDNRNRFIDHMLSNGVSAGVHYKPLTHYANLFPGPHEVPVTERVWKTLVTLPLYPDMTDGEVEQVVDAVRAFPA